MTTFKNQVNAFGNSAGDDMEKHITRWSGSEPGMPLGKLKRYPTLDVSSGNRRLARAKYGDGGGSGTSFCGKNAFTKGKGK
jgi:hypothetical protein